MNISGISPFSSPFQPPLSPGGFINSPTGFGQPSSPSFAAGSFGAPIPQGLAQAPFTSGPGPQIGQNVNGFTSQMPAFNHLQTVPGMLQPPPLALPAFDYSGLNGVNNRQAFQGMPYVQQVPLQGYLQLGNGQLAQNIQLTPFIPFTIPGSITNIQQLNNMPGASSTTLAAELQLAGISPSVLSTIGASTGAFIPPIFGLGF